jgi:hypothetical protein
MKPADAIESGRIILDPLLNAAGFAFGSVTEGKGSGGCFASAAYTRGDRQLSFSYRNALGCVEYSVGSSSLEHISYMRLLDKYDACRFASYSHDHPLAGFFALRHDLECFAGDFLNGTADEFRRLALKLKTMPNGRFPPYLP